MVDEKEMNSGSEIQTEFLNVGVGFISNAEGRGVFMCTEKKDAQNSSQTTLVL